LKAIQRSWRSRLPDVRDRVLVAIAATRYSMSVARKHMYCLAALALLPCSDVPRRAVVGGAPVAPAALAVDDDTVAGRRHYARGYPADDSAGVNAVIEIPSGTTGKFEVDDGDGWLHWQRDRDHGGRREVDYLSFPVNYGMVPRTLAGDGDALDIAVLGRGIERGHVARTRVIGVQTGGRFHSASCSRRRPLGRSANRAWYVPSQRTECSIGDVTPKNRIIQRPYCPPGLCSRFASRRSPRSTVCGSLGTSTRSPARWISWSASGSQPPQSSTQRSTYSAHVRPAGGRLLTVTGASIPARCVVRARTLGVSFRSLGARSRGR
jgi:hypothetical protein